MSCLSDGVYNEVSVERAKEFIRKFKQLLGDKPFLWLAFQSNSLNARCWSSDNFESDFKEMIKALEKDLHFYSPKLNFNMRNSSEIGKLAETMQSEYVGTKMTNVLPSLPTPKSSITAIKPTLFPIKNKDLQVNYFKMFEITTENGKMNVVLIDSEKNFDVEKVKKAVIKCGIEREDIFVHTYKSNNSKEDIKRFLANQNCFLICVGELFTGMEADSVIYCVGDSDVDKNVRVNVMRACSRLNIIYAYDTDDDRYIDFSSAKLDPNFMSGCDEEMEFCLIKCLQCKKKENNDNVIVCKSCFIRCHSGHEKESIDIEDIFDDDDDDGEFKEQIVPCECNMKCSNCNFTRS